MEDKDSSICTSNEVSLRKQPKKTKQFHVVIDNNDVDDDEIMQSCHIYSSQVHKFRNMKRKLAEKVLLMDPDAISDEELSEPKNKITRKKRGRKTEEFINLDDSSEDLSHSEARKPLFLKHCSSDSYIIRCVIAECNVMESALCYGHPPTEKHYVFHAQQEKKDELRSPSPPPSVHLKSYRTRKVSSKSNKLFKELQEAELLYKATCLIYNNDDLNNSFQENTDKIDSNNREIQVKIRCHSSIHRISMKRGQKFATVMTQLSDIVGSCTEEIFLYFDEKMVQMEDTPDSLGVTVADILDCFIIKTKKMEAESIGECSQANKMTIKIQSQNTRQKLNFTVNKFSPLSSLMEDYAKQTNNVLEKLTFKFDGEIISPTDTPFELDMDDDDCLDVKIKE